MSTFPEKEAGQIQIRNLPFQQQAEYDLIPLQIAGALLHHIEVPPKSKQSKLGELKKRKPSCIINAGKQAEEAKRLQREDLYAVLPQMNKFRCTAFKRVV